MRYLKFVSHTNTEYYFSIEGDEFTLDHLNRILITMGNQKRESRIECDPILKKSLREFYMEDSLGEKEEEPKIWGIEIIPVSDLKPPSDVKVVSIEKAERLAQTNRVRLSFDEI